MFINVIIYQVEFVQDLEGVKLLVLSDSYSSSAFFFSCEYLPLCKSSTGRTN